MRFYPFAELLDGDDFVFHPDAEQHCEFISPFYRKIDRFTYENTETHQEYGMNTRDILTARVSKVVTEISELPVD